MTVRLDAKIRGGSDAALKMGAQEELSAEFEREKSLDTEFAKGVKLTASVETQPSLGIASNAVSVPVDNDYEALYNKPSIEGVELVGDRTFAELGLVELTNEQILEIWNTVQRSS